MSEDNVQVIGYGFWVAVCAVALGSCMFYFVSRFLAIRYTREEGSLDEAAFRRAQAVNDTWRTVAQIVGGAAFVVTFVWTVFQDRDNDARARQQEANRLYIEASKLLSADNDPVEKSAGVYALKLVAGDRPAYGLPVRELLVTLIRGHAAEAGKASGLDFPRDAPVDLSIQAAIGVLGRRDRSLEEPGRPLDLSGAYLVGGNFKDTQGFSGALFWSGAILYGADFRSADVSYTRFDSAKLSDWKAYGVADGAMSKAEKGSKVWNKDIPFTEDWRRWQRYRFVADFGGATLKSATFTGTGLTGALLNGADVDGADFTRANITRADFSGAKNLKTATFSKACYSGDVRDRPIFDPDAGATFIAAPADSAPGVIAIGVCP